MGGAILEMNYGTRRGKTLATVIVILALGLLIGTQSTPVANAEVEPNSSQTDNFAAFDAVRQGGMELLAPRTITPTAALDGIQARDAGIAVGVIQPENPSAVCE